MIVKAFLRWSETAKVADRASAANALGRAYLVEGMNKEQHEAAYMALTYLLDDPSPRVRLSLAEAICDSPVAPRAIVFALAEDQPEISGTVIMRSPVLRDMDLVDLVGRGDVATRSFIAARPYLTRGVCAALAEVADLGELFILLENELIDISRISLRRIVERFGEQAEIRNLLLERDDLPADARHALLNHVGSALACSDLVNAFVDRSRIDYVIRDAGDTATVEILASVPQADMPAFVDHLRKSGELNPALLIYALCAGRLSFFSEAMSNLSQLDEKRVRSILATGRVPAVQVLFHSAGLSKDICAVFVDATLLWRDAAQSISGVALEDICGNLVAKFRARHGLPAVVDELLDMLEKLQMNEQRQRARSYASGLMIDAA
ncbi:DUF2336 domain-containing protein [Agrobacterium sp. Azo12]|uniref:DUF2336 domain-containing protein n=1 Tax=Agrobacterium sp. Azo12 TaxID=3031129 RepID=UPI0023D8BF9B|nr:DUF2336 domain-containing protein [Agrobacterium sp. Azo12]MDO5895957.1 DUF2336 domain-containing protein [Agrobacterium sp. Azo12]